MFYALQQLFFCCCCFELCCICGHNYTTLEVGLFLKGSIYSNHSLVNISDIGEGSAALHCFTNKSDCCRRSEGQVSGEWYFPGNGSTVGTSGGAGSIYRNRGPSVVRLNRRNNAMMPSGVFRCEIPDANGTNQNIYVGVYSVENGAPTINEPLEYSYDAFEQVVVCTTMGGPATNVRWWKDGIQQVEQLQRISDTVNSVYENVLVVGQQSPDEVVGNYTCSVSNVRGEDNKTIQLHGK